MPDELKLSELRRYAIAHRTAVTFRHAASGRAAVVSDSGLVQIPGISGRPSFSAEELLAAADEFRLEPSGGAARTVARDELAGLLKRAAPTTAAPKEED